VCVCVSVKPQRCFEMLLLLTAHASNMNKKAIKEKTLTNSHLYKMKLSAGTTCYFAHVYLMLQLIQSAMRIYFTFVKPMLKNFSYHILFFTYCVCKTRVFHYCTDISNVSIKNFWFSTPLFITQIILDKMASGMNRGSWRYMSTVVCCTKFTADLLALWMSVFWVSSWKQKK
jgi:hypothetical protein